MKTRVTELLNIKYPILQGSMAWIADAELAAAVSNAGGAGIISASGRDGAWARKEIRKAKSLTSNTFGINISLDRLGTPRYKQKNEELMNTIIEEHVSFVIIGAGNPAPYIDRFHEANIKVIGIVPNSKLAKKVESIGADAVVIEGMESGGRIGNITTMALMSNVIPEISIPVVVAGGIVDGRGLAAALIMGADGIQMGSRFLLSEECKIHPSYKQSIIDAKDIDNVSIGLSRGLGMRGLKSPYSEKYMEMENGGASNEELQEFTRGISKKVAEFGIGEDGMNGIVQVGQSLNRLDEILPCNVIINNIMEEAIIALKNGRKYYE